MEWITALLVIFGLYLVFKNLTTDSRKNIPPGPKSYPIIGSVLEIDMSLFHLQACEYAKKYGKILEIKVFNAPIVLLNSVDLVYKAFCEEENKVIFNGRPRFFVTEYVLSSLSIGASQAGKRHSDLRKAFAKGLHIYGDGIERFEKVMKSEIHGLMAEIEQFDGREFEFVDLAKRSVSNVISILLIGEHASEEDFINHCELLNQADYFTTPLANMLMMYFPFLKQFQPFKSKLEKLVLTKNRVLEKVLYQTKVTRNPGSIRCLVDFFFDEQEREITEGVEPILTDQVISSVILELFFAGIATTTSSLSSVFLYLINHPEYQMKIQEELDSVIGPNREPSIQDKLNHRCNFLEAFILETLRHAPPTPLLLPHDCTQDVVFEGYHLKKNSQVFANVFHIHHDENIWGDPWVFRPERFLDEKNKLLPSSHVYMKSWLPFGTGRRKCPGFSLGMTRIFLYLSHLLHRWTFIPSRNNMSYDPRGEGYEGGTVLKPKPFYCIAKPRK